MSESMSSPWIRDYLIDVAETHGAQLYNAPAATTKKKVQLTDFLTYQDDSYVWAWISDKDYKVSARISKDAVDEFKRSKHQRNIIDCRFFLVFVASYRPMFSPRPLGPNTRGNTAVSHISLEIDHVAFMGTGAHVFGNPRDLESDQNIKEWILGLRQDGGGGNILKLRKQQKPIQNKKAPPSLLPPLPSRHASIPQSQATKADVAQPMVERSQDYKRMYAKRWRLIEVDPWKRAIKPVVEEGPMQPELSHPLGEPILDVDRPESRHHEPAVPPTSPHHTPSPVPSQRHGTPTDWSPSNRGSSVVPDMADPTAQQPDESELPTSAQLPSDTEGHATVDGVTTSDASLQPPTPAQRIKRSPPPSSSSLPRSSPDLSQQQSSPPPSSSLSLPSSSLPMPVGIRRNFQRKVPHPGLSAPRLNSTKQAPIQILVPNSDTSGVGSSQPHPQSQHLSQSQQSQILSHSPALPSSLAKEFKPCDASTSREQILVNTSRRMSKTFAEPLPIPGHAVEQETTSVEAKDMAEAAEPDTGNQCSESCHPLVPSAPRIEVLEVEKSDAEEEIDELQLTHSTGTGVGPGQQTDQDASESDTNSNHENSQSSIDEVVTQVTFQGSPSLVPSRLASESMESPSPTRLNTDRTTIRPSVSQCSMHSLFSEDERTAFSQVLQPPTSQTEEIQEKITPSRIPTHDAEAWKEPSFISRTRSNGKTRPIVEPDTPIVKMGEKRRRSAQPKAPTPKRAKLSSPKTLQTTSNGTNVEILDGQATETPANGKMRPSNPPASVADVTISSSASHSSEARLASFVAGFEKVDLGKGVPVPELNMLDIKCILLTTGRIRECEDVEKDGSPYINE